VKPSFVVALVFAALPSFAAPPAPKGGGTSEAQARALQKKAIEEDLLSVEFDAAKVKLEKAAKLCSANCPAALKASLDRDLGVVLISGKMDKSAAVDAFVRAMKADATIQLDRDTKTKEIETVWNEAKKLAFAQHATTNASEGDFIHTAPAAQLVNAPMPLYVEYDGDDDIGRVLAKYKGFGMTEWKSIELKPMGEGFAATIPCKDVLEGPLQYFITGFDKDNTPVANAGDKSKPFIVRVRKEVAAADRAHFPGAEAPAQCKEASDCPPNFPGCKSQAAADDDLGEIGDECDTGSDCRSGVCAKGVCAVPGTSSKRGASSSSSSSGTAGRVFVGLSGGFDMVFMPETKDACLLNTADGKPLGAGVYCTSGTSDFPARTSYANERLRSATDPNIDPKRSADAGGTPGFPGKINSGTAVGTVSANVHVDYALTNNFLVGARLGWLFNGYTGTAGVDEGATLGVPMHAEARGTYYFGDDPLAGEGLSFYVFGGAGVTQQAAFVETNVRYGADPNRVADADGGTPDAGQKETVFTGKVKGWFLGGPGMVGVGAGARYALNPNVAVFAAPRLQFTFGGGAFGTAISPEFGMQYGF
jgi:hypothetical protein